ncbi:hypothetical protein D3C76_1239550 [compost metagenome]
MQHRCPIRLTMVLVLRGQHICQQCRVVVIQRMQNICIDGAEAQGHFRLFSARGREEIFERGLLVLGKPTNQ